MFDKLKKPIHVISLFCLLFIIIGCKHEYPTFDEYEVVGFVPVDSAKNGMLFISGERLFALCDTTWSYSTEKMLTEYSLQDPINPMLQNTVWLLLPRMFSFIEHQDSLVFFEATYYDFTILNLNNRESIHLNLGYSVKDVAHKDHFLFLCTYDGLRVLDISNLPEYVEVFNDTIARTGTFLTLRDTILLDMYQYGNYYRTKLWNVKNPEIPELIYNGELPEVYSLRHSPVMTDQYVILFDYYAIRRYRHEMYDTLISEDMLYMDLTYINPKTSDSLIYLHYPSYYIKVIRMDDFDAEPSMIATDDWFYQILSFEIFEERIYVLVREEGIYVLQRRAS